MSEDGTLFILRTKGWNIVEGKRVYGYADGDRDDYEDGMHVGSCLDSSSKVKWAEQFDTYESAEEVRLLDPYAEEWEVVTLKQAEEEYYGR